MARAQGINTNFTKVLGLMISNGLVALAGALLAQYQGFSDINMGRGAIVIGLAAVIIGEVIFGKIFRNFALKLLGRRHRRDHLLRGHPGLCCSLGLSTDDLKLLTALGSGAVPGHSLLEGQVLYQGRQEGEAQTMLDIQKHLQDLQRRHGQRKTWRCNGVTLTLEDGDFVTVIGGNGAGKSTMLNAVAGVWPVDSGQDRHRRRRTSPACRSTSAPSTSAACFRTR